MSTPAGDHQWWAVSLTSIIFRMAYMTCAVSVHKAILLFILLIINLPNRVVLLTSIAWLACASLGGHFPQSPFQDNIFIDLTISKKTWN